MYLSNPEMWEAAPLVPWFAWALLPLTVANVLVQNILARGRFKRRAVADAGAGDLRGGALRCRRRP